MRHPSLAAAALLAVLTPALALAGGAPQKHDGLYVHADLGVGALGAQSKTEDGRKVELSGGGAELSLAVGGAVTENFVLAGRLYAASVTDPTFKVAGQKVDGMKGSLGLSGIGLDLTYYFMPINVYVTATPSITTVTVETKFQGVNEKDTSKNGFGLRLAVGKEWFLSDNFGLGLELQYVGSSNKTKPTDAEPTSQTISSGWLGLGISATYN